VALRFDTSCFSFSIGSRYFLPSRPGHVVQRPWAFVARLLTRLIKDHDRRNTGLYSLWLRRVSSFPPLPFSFLVVSAGRGIGVQQSDTFVLVNSDIVAQGEDGIVTCG
jgi:hypothetical protein